MSRDVRAAVRAAAEPSPNNPASMFSAHEGMSEASANLEEQETVAAAGHGELDGASPDPVGAGSSEASCSDLQGLLPAGQLTPADVSPSPSAETSGLLSLPWEMVAHIASHLPAQCVITVLPKVCHALGDVGKDSTAWQLRARRLVGSRATFPVGPKDDFDWAKACVELEQLITCWADQGQLVDRRTRGDEVEREQMREGERAEQDGQQIGEGQEDGGEDEIEGVGVIGQEVAYGADEGVEVALEVEDGEMQPNIGEDQIARLREVLEERLDDDAAPLMEEEREHRMGLEADNNQDGALNHRENLAGPRNQGNGRQVEIDQHKSPRSPSPPPALECMVLPSDHIAQVNSLLLLGGEGKVCATGSRDWNVKLWDLQAQTESMLLYTLGRRGDFSTHRGWVWCLTSRGPMLASGGFDSTVRLWDLEAGGAHRGLIKAGAAVHTMSWQPDLLLVGTFDKRVSMYDTRAAEPLVKSLRLHGNAVMCLAADDKYIICGSKDCTVSLYDRRAGKVLKRIWLGSYLLSMSYSGNEIWAGDNSGMLHSFSMKSGTLKSLSQFDVGHRGLVTGIHRSPGSLYTCSSDCTVKVHIPCGPPRTLCTLRQQAAVSGLSVEAGVLALASGDMSVEIWRPRQ